VQTGSPKAGWFDFRAAAGVILLAAAAVFTWYTIDGLAARRKLRTELAEISHVRYGLLNADQWVHKLTPIVNAQIEGLDLKAQDAASLRPTVISALNRLLENVKQKMSTPDPKAADAGGVAGFLGQGNSLIANMIVDGLKPHVPEYADVVLAELQRPENKAAVKKYVRGVLTDGARNTFGVVDMRWHDYILKAHGCADTAACQQELGQEVAEADRRISRYYLTVLGASALAFLLILAGVATLGRGSVLVLMLVCLVLLAGGILTPMLEVEAKISKLGMTFLGKPIEFSDQLLYFQSKSVLEVFHTLVTMGQPEMWFVGMLVLMFSVVFPTLKMLTLGACLFRPALLRSSRIVRFLALESSKWSMADVMVLAIFMSFVAFNGLIGNAMSGLERPGTELVIPTNSSKILPGYFLFIGFCLASLTLSKKLEKGIRAGAENG
jgi:hypothetical protein